MRVHNRSSREMKERVIELRKRHPMWGSSGAERGNRSPVEIMEEILDYQREILILPPIIIDDLIPMVLKDGYHVGKSVLPSLNFQWWIIKIG